MDYGLILKNAYTLWLKDKKSLFYTLIYFLAGLFFVAISFGIVWLFFQDAWIQMMAASTYSTTVTPDPSMLTSLLTSMLVLIPVSLLQILVLYFIGILMRLRALEVLGFKTVPITLSKFFKLILLWVWTTIAAVISWHKKTFLYLFIGLMVLAIITLALFVLGQWLPGIILTVILLPLTIIYSVIIIYNSMRLSLSSAIILQKDQGVFDTAKEAWDLAEGKVLEILIAVMVILIPILIVGMIVGLIAGVLSALMNTAFLSTAIQQIVQIIISPLTAIIFAFGFITVYSEVLKSKALKPV
ncbi:MAG: hypothetical protein ABIA76_00845 [Candidatus Diapherotrites archaeon]